MIKRHKSKKGFTIIELLIATTVFSVMLMVFLAAFLRVSQLFYKGVNMARTQETARNLLQSISDDIQFSRGLSLNYGDGSPYFCVGGHRYAYNLGQQVGSSGPYGIAREEMSACRPLDVSEPGGQPVGANYVELLDPGMQVNRLDLTPLNGAVNISFHIVFYGGDPSVLVPNATDPDARCSGPAVSTQYCVTADYSRSILQSF